MLFTLLRSFRDPPPSTSPPVLHPKTPSMTADMALGKSASRAVHKPTLSPTAELGRLESEEYVATDVFRIDRQTQEEIDVSLVSLLMLQSHTCMVTYIFPHSNAVLLQQGYHREHQTGKRSCRRHRSI